MGLQEELVPILHVKDARRTAHWYKRLGFIIEGEHQFAPDLPYYLFLRRGSEALHLSEHTGDAKPGSLVYLYAHDIEDISREFDVEIKVQPWAREVHLNDPDGNRIRVGERIPKDDIDS